MDIWEIPRSCDLFDTLYSVLIRFYVLPDQSSLIRVNSESSFIEKEKLRTVNEEPRQPRQPRQLS